MSAVEETRLENGPKPNDVIFGRGQGAGRHPGNRAFLELTQKNVANYRKAHTRKQKKQVTTRIVQSAIQKGVEFWKQDKKRRSSSSGDDTVSWERADPETVRIRVGQSLRYLIKVEDDKMNLPAPTFEPIPVQFSTNKAAPRPRQRARSSQYDVLARDITKMEHSPPWMHRRKTVKSRHSSPPDEIFHPSLATEYEADPLEFSEDFSSMILDDDQKPKAMNPKP